MQRKLSHIYVIIDLVTLQHDELDEFIRKLLSRSCRSNLEGRFMNDNKATVTFDQQPLPELSDNFPMIYCAEVIILSARMFLF